MRRVDSPPERLSERNLLQRDGLSLILISQLTEKATKHMFNQLSDEAWFAKLIQSQSNSSLGLPAFPSDAVQRTFVGQSGETALKEAFVFYQAVLRRLGAEVRETNLLDFGVGWGRIIRMFLRDTDPSILWRRRGHSDPSSLR